MYHLLAPGSIVYWERATLVKGQKISYNEVDMTISVLYPTEWTDYECIDSGNGKKLERFGTYSINRPDPRILWTPSLPKEHWDLTNATFIQSDSLAGRWVIQNTAPNPWRIGYKNLTFELQSTNFKHVGIFPEQAVNWDWIIEKVNKRPLRILNLFAYTGGATLASASAGTMVTHVDSVKSVLAWAKKNTELSHVASNGVRWICDDAYKFVLREGRRSSTYDAIIMDPPRFGRGSQGEVWKLHEDLPKLLHACLAILSPNPQFFLINTYTADISSIVLGHLLHNMFKDKGGVIESGELAIQEAFGKRLIPHGIYARWSNV